MKDLPPLSKAAIKRLEALADLPDDQIDFSDLPELDEAWFKRAVLVPAVSSTGSRDFRVRLEEAMRMREKKPISLRLDLPVYDWFKAQGPRYQSRINAVLRAYMEANR